MQALTLRDAPTAHAAQGKYYRRFENKNHYLLSINFVATFRF